MKYAFAVSMLAAVYPLAASAGFTDEVDRFSGVRTVSWSSTAEAGEIFGFSSSAFVSPKAPKAPMYDLTLIAAGTSWRYLNCHSVQWLVDGKPAPYIKSAYNSSMSGSVTIEMLQANLKQADMVKLSKATLIEYQVCNDEGKIDAKGMEGLRRVVSSIR